MHTPRLTSSSLLLSFALLSFGATPRAQGLATRAVATGLGRPIWAGAPEGDDRLFVAQQAGLIKLFENGALAGTFLDIRSLRVIGDEQGLLGMAFHPDYANNGTFYLNYTRASDGATIVSSWRVSADPNVADPTSETILLRRNQPFANHNAGWIGFGPGDGYLYVTMGDGGGSNDPGCNAQDLANWLGALLRIDVDGGTPYAIPPDNPFLATPGARPEIFHYGLRNPWRVSFDRLTGDLYIGDVGQDRREEISFAAAGASGLNFGWKVMEGTRCNSSAACDPTVPACGAPELVDPIYELPHSLSTGPGAIIGGHVYRGCAMPWLQGTYFFADNVDDVIRSFEYDPVSGTVSNFVDRTAELDPPGAAVIDHISSFGEDGFGELLILSRPNPRGAGAVYKVVPANATASAAVPRNGLGVNTPCFRSLSPPVLGSTWRLGIDTSGHPGAYACGFLGYATPTGGGFFPGGELLVDVTSPRNLSEMTLTAGGMVTIDVAIPCDPVLNGFVTHAQAYVLGKPWELCNAVDATLGWY